MATADWFGKIFIKIHHSTIFSNRVLGRLPLCIKIKIAIKWKLLSLQVKIIPNKYRIYQEVIFQYFVCIARFLNNIFIEFKIYRKMILNFYKLITSIKIDKPIFYLLTTIKVSYNFEKKNQFFLNYLIVEMGKASSSTPTKNSIHFKKKWSIKIGSTKTLSADDYKNSLVL